MVRGGGRYSLAWLLEGDQLRRALLCWFAERRGLDFRPEHISFAAVREARLDALGDLIADHLGTDALEESQRRWRQRQPGRQRHR